MTDGSSAIARDQERNRATKRLEFEIRCYALGDRSKKQRDRVLEAAKDFDDIKGNGYFSAPSMGGTSSRIERRLKKYDDNDPAEWIGLIVGWKPQSIDFFDISFSTYPSEKELAERVSKCLKKWDTEEGYEAMRAKAPIDPKTKIYLVGDHADEYHKDLYPDDKVYQRFLDEAKKRDWRTKHTDRTRDNYAILVGPTSHFDIVWLGCYFLDMTNFTPDVRLGPERSRLATSKKRVSA